MSDKDVLEVILTQLNRISDSQELVKKDISEINVTLAKQEVSLADHIRRTEILEAELKPLKKHDAYFVGCLKLIGVLGTLATIAGIVLKVCGVI